MAHNINGRAEPKYSVGFAPLEGYGLDAKGSAEGYPSVQRTNKNESLCWDLQIPIYKAYHLKDLSLFHVSMLKVIQRNQPTNPDTNPMMLLYHSNMLCEQP